jgi:hypothetical protein
MAEKPKKLGIWLAMAGSALGVGLFLWLRISYLKSHGQNIFWLAELFSPVAIISILVVTFVEKLVDPPKARARARKK